MRTKNAKGLWPVPAILAVMVVAALLAFGLMATNGAQPAAAQSDDPDCEVSVEIAADSTGSPTVDNMFTGGDNPEDCRARDGTAMIEFTGTLAADATPDDPAKLDLLIQDDSGPIRAYLNDHVNYIANENEYQISSTGENAGLGDVNSKAPSPMRWRIQTIEVPLPTRNAQGQVENQSVTVSVSGDVVIFQPNASLTTLVTGVTDDLSDKRYEVEANRAGDIDILFLGAPSFGEDGIDLNDDLDDMRQCIVNGSDPEEEGERNPDGSCATGSTADILLDDPDESRTKLVVVTNTVTTADGAITRITLDGSPTNVLGGASENHQLMGPSGRERVTIFAVLQDAEGNPLTGLDVDFNASPMPSDVIASRDLTEDDETAVATAPEATVAGIETVDAVASYTLDSLPTNTLYRIEVDVTLGSMKLGTVVLYREGDAESIAGASFNIDCLGDFDAVDQGEETDLTTGSVNLDRSDDCGMQSRYGDGQTVVIKAHVEDELGNVIAGDLKASLDDGSDEDALTMLTQPDSSSAWILTVETGGDDAIALGEHTVTVSHDDDDGEVPDHTITFTVAGSPHDLAIGGADSIPLGGSQTFTVTATDMLGGIPHLIDTGEDRNDKVTVSVQPTDALVVGTDNAGQVTLNDYGTAEFTIYASLDADDGRQRHQALRLGTAH